MAKIRLKTDQYGDSLVVEFVEHYPVVYGEVTDRGTLHRAFEVVPGASHGDEKEVDGGRHPDGDGWSLFHITIPLSRENVTALRISGFDWEPDAAKAASGYRLAKDYVDQVRHFQMSTLEQQAALCGFTLVPLRRVRKKWWNFWKP